MSDPFVRFTLTFVVAFCPAHICRGEADAICEKWDTKKMAKRDEQAETTLWNNRVYTAPMLLQEPKDMHGTGGHVVSIGVGGGVGVGLRDDRFVDPLLTWADLD